MELDIDMYTSVVSKFLNTSSIVELDVVESCCINGRC